VPELSDAGPGVKLISGRPGTSRGAASRCYVIDWPKDRNYWRGAVIDKARKRKLGSGAHALQSSLAACSPALPQCPQAEPLHLVYEHQGAVSRPATSAFQRALIQTARWVGCRRRVTYPSSSPSPRRLQPATDTAQTLLLISTRRLPQQTVSPAKNGHRGFRRAHNATGLALEYPDSVSHCSLSASLRALLSGRDLHRVSRSRVQHPARFSPPRPHRPRQRSWPSRPS
jgi:hypothetical protein